MDAVFTGVAFQACAAQRRAHKNGVGGAADGPGPGLGHRRPGRSRGRGREEVRNRRRRRAARGGNRAGGSATAAVRTPRASQRLTGPRRRRASPEQGAGAAGGATPPGPTGRPRRGRGGRRRGALRGRGRPASAGTVRNPVPTPRACCQHRPGAEPARRGARASPGPDTAPARAGERAGPLKAVKASCSTSCPAPSSPARAGRFSFSRVAVVEASPVSASRASRMPGDRQLSAGQRVRARRQGKNGQCHHGRAQGVEGCSGGCAHGTLPSPAAAMVAPADADGCGLSPDSTGEFYRAAKSIPDGVSLSPDPSRSGSRPGTVRRPRGPQDGRRFVRRAKVRGRRWPDLAAKSRCVLNVIGAER